MSRPPWARAALSHPVFTGLSRQHLGDLIAELADPWTAAHQGALRTRRGHPPRRAAGAPAELDQRRQAAPPRAAPQPRSPHLATWHPERAAAPARQREDGRAL